MFQFISRYDFLTALETNLWTQTTKLLPELKEKEDEIGKGTPKDCSGGKSKLMVVVVYYHLFFKSVKPKYKQYLK